MSGETGGRAHLPPLARLARLAHFASLAAESFTKSQDILS
jgi:hypothetical protein